MLEALGLDAGVEAVYAAMLAAPTAGVAELATRLNRSEGDIHSALDVLADLALLRPSQDHPETLLPVAPAAGLRALVRRQEQELAARQREIEAGHTAAAQLIANHAAQAEPHRATGDTEHLIGLDAIQARLEELLSQATVEAMSLVPGKSIPTETLSASRAIDDGLARRGVPTRVLYQDSVRSDPATVAYGLWMAERGTLIRTTPLLPQRLLIVDRRVAVVPLDPSDPGAGALCTTALGLVDQLIALFEQIWAGATPLEEARPVETETGLTAIERELLRLLAAGSTDVAAASRLGISLRTVRRMMADLMTRLQATSRFEAGLKAVKRGWL